MLTDELAIAKLKSPPRQTCPSFRTRSNSLLRVKRRDFGNESFPGTPTDEIQTASSRNPLVHRIASTPYKKIFPASRRGRFFAIFDRDYGLGDELVVVVVEVPLPGEDSVVEVLDDEDEEPPAGDDLSITVVLVSLFFSPGGLVTVVSFCSQAVRKAMLIKIQMYFIILRIRKKGLGCVSREWLRENYLYQPGWWWSLSSLCPNSCSGLPRAPRFQSFAHMPPVMRRQLKCRSIYS